MRRLLTFVAVPLGAALLLHCGSPVDTDDGDASVVTDLSAPPTDMAVKADLARPAADGASVDLGKASLASCLDRPDVLPTPPGPTLPCDLIPPGVVLPAQ